MLNISDMDLSFRFDNLKIKVISISYGVFLHPFPRHRHGSRFYEAHLVCGGKGRLIADGREYPLSADTLYMTGPLVVHEQLTDSADPMDEYCFQFEVNEGRHGKGSTSADILKNTSFWLGFDTQNMRRLFEMLTEESERQEIGFAKSVVNLSSQLLISLARNYAGSEKTDGYTKITPGDKRTLIVDNSFLYDYATLTLDELSRRLNLSSRQTQRFLKKAYNKTFIELRSEARQDKARELVKNGASLPTAAAAVGYENERSLRKR